MGWLEVSVLVIWLLGWLLSWHLPLLPKGQCQAGPRVSVLIPARDEEETLPHLLAALSQQRFQPHEVIVIDYHSSDRTAAVALEWAAALPITVVQGPEIFD
jgi:cellulose synthase/poly-beta-1,6-N-acetylglucosamine synthase-like glycosyltransferase